jgi:hypothetical protein
MGEAFALISIKPMKFRPSAITHATTAEIDPGHCRQERDTVAWRTLILPPVS